MGCRHVAEPPAEFSMRNKQDTKRPLYLSPPADLRPHNAVITLDMIREDYRAIRCVATLRPAFLDRLESAGAAVPGQATF